MKKILFLLASYPDARRSASKLCTHRVIEHIMASGRYEVHTLCYLYPGECKEEIVNNIIVHRFSPSKWTQIRQKIKSSGKFPRVLRIIELLQKILTIPTFPQTKPISTSIFYRTAEELYQKFSFDLIVSEHHGLDTLLTGCKLKQQNREIKHLAIFWDPLKGQIPTAFLPKSYTENRIDRLEKYVAQNTTLQISMSSIRSFYKEKGDVAEDHRIFLDIPSILAPDEEVASDYLQLLQMDRINIVYSGLLNPVQRDPLPIIHLLNQCECSERINLLFFSMGAKDEIQNAAKTFRGKINYHDYIPLVELHTIYRHADYLLNISHINAKMIPSKIFEYMSYGKPIISTFLSEGDSAQKYIVRYPEGLCIDLKRQDKENVGLLNKFLSRSHKDVSFMEVKKEFKENTPETFLRVIDGM